jgi:hypothetical protein
MKLKDVKTPAVVSIIGILTAGSTLALSPETAEFVTKYLSDAGQNQFTRDLIIFSLAAAIHSGRMKKEIRTNFETLVVAIDKVSTTLREDLKKHRDKLDGLEVQVTAQGVEIDKLKLSQETKNA